MTGPIPTELGSLANLQWLWLYGNQLSGAIPTELGSLSKLQVLDLSQNQLTGPIPASLGGLAKLQVLDLSQNQLTGAIPTELGSLSKLQVLYLWGNQLTSPIPASLGGLANLEQLDLSQNQLSGAIPTELGSLSKLQVLYLWGNQLTGPIPAELGSLANLRYLYLYGNQLSGSVPTWLGSLANLQGLHLYGNQLSGEIPAELGSLTDLEELFLSGNQLTGCIPVGIAGVATNDFNQLGLPFCAGALGAPTIGTLTPGADFLTITWAAPTGSPESAIIAYDLRYIESAASDKSDVNWNVVDNAWTAGSGALSYQIAGLANGTRYDVQVRPVTATGDGPWSATAPGTPATWGAIRSFSPPSVAPAGEVVVMITANGFGSSGQVVETLPPGFSYVSSSLSDGAVTVEDRELSFILFEQTAFTYTVDASSTEGTYSFSGVLTNFTREEFPVAGALTITVGALPAVSVSRAAGGEDTKVRPGSPVSLTATFSRPVSGFVVEDISVAKGSAGNFAGSGAVYTLDVTPNAIGEVTVDIAAGVAEDADGKGNAAGYLSLGITYDDDGDGAISRNEAIAAITDYFADRITRDEVLGVITLYFAS